jgi:hypothetical protein
MVSAPDAAGPGAKTRNRGDQPALVATRQLYAHGPDSIYKYNN